MTRSPSLLLQQTAAHPVLVDIGASEHYPRVWTGIASDSVYIGFEPDARELPASTSDFFEAHIVRSAAVSDPHEHEATIHLTRSPFCSSLLEPDHESLSSYLFSDLFLVERTTTVPATTLGAALGGLSVERVHWFKTDSQGIDLRLFKSLPDSIRSRVLAVDVEPGLMDAYRGEDLFVDAHQHLIREGFWLSRLDVKGTGRLAESTLRRITSEVPTFDREVIEGGLRRTPCWCEARYLRSVRSLREDRFDRQDWIVSWVFSMLDQQPGAALDLAMGYEQRYGPDPFSRLMIDTPIELIRGAARTPLVKRAYRAAVPEALRRRITRLRHDTH